MKYNDVIQLQREAQIALAILSAEKLLPMYEYCYAGDYRPHKAIGIAMQYVQAADNGDRDKLEIDAELAMLEVNSARGYDCTGVANVAWHTIKAIACPARTAESCAYAVCYASRIVEKAGIVCARLGDANKYATDFDELARQAVAMIEANK